MPYIWNSTYLDREETLAKLVILQSSENKINLPYVLRLNKQQMEEIT